MSLKAKGYTKLIVGLSSILSISLVVFIAINANYYLTRMSHNNTELYDAYRISELMKGFRSNLIQQENKLKGYQITGDAKFMEQYKQKETEIKTNLKTLEKYFDGKQQEEAFYQLKNLTYKKLLEAKDLRQGISLAGFQAKGTVEEPVLETMDEINSVIDEINTSLAQSTQVLLNNSVDYLRVSKKWSLLEVALGVLVALAGVIILFRDINLRNHLEQELRNAKKQAEDIAIAKEQFMANMSHEIRTPMNAILGFSDLMGKTPLNQEQSEYLQAISNSGSNLLNIINDILDFSKIEAGKLHIEKISFPLHEVLKGIEIMFGPKAKEKNILLEVKKDPAIPEQLYGDPTRLNQVLNNLVNNAIKFTSGGQVTLSCELKSVEHDVANLVFRIKDTGIGIAPAKLQSIFERFDQGNKETTRVYGGTGLGLAIVKNLVEMQNGDIYVKSKEGQGSEFVVSISYPVSYELPENKNRSSSSMAVLAHGNKTILLVEDHILNQKLAETYLRGFGFEVTLAGNGIEALQQLKKKSFNLVLMDIQMPLLDGYHTAEKIRKELRLNLPIIAMTAHSLPGEKEKCIQFGMNDYISKPFKEKDLHQLLQHYLGPVESEPVPANDTTISRSPANKLLNLDDLYALARGNQEFIQEMISIFLEQNPEDTKALQDAAKSANYQQLRSIAHRMKTSVGFMGMKSLLSPLSEIELLAEKNESIEVIRKKTDSLIEQCQEACKELNQELTKPSRV